jgi:signal transduction histidine kinase
MLPLGPLAHALHRAAILGNHHLAELEDKLRFSVAHEHVQALSHALACVALAAEGIARVERASLLPVPGPQQLDVEVAAIADRIGYREGCARLIVDASVPCCVLADPILLAVLMEELLDNAARWGAAPRIRVRLDAVYDDDRVHITVADDGAGLAADFDPDTHVPFRRRPDGRPGLGLLVAGRIVAVHGGRLSVGPGVHGGAQVQFDLPAA